MSRVAVAADHNGVALKSDVLAHLATLGHDAEDLGGHEPSVRVDYPPLCDAVCDRIVDGRADLGIIIGGSGQGESIVCNRRRGIRAGVAWSRWACEISRGNNDANVMIIPAKALRAEESLSLLDIWLTTAFKGGVHAARVAQIDP